jgi:phosphatidate cytidylyltransferase
MEFKRTLFPFKSPLIKFLSDKEILLRILTSLIGIPLVLGVIYAGTPYSDALIVMLLSGMLFEWSRLNTQVLLHPVCFAVFIQTIFIFYGPPISLSAHGFIASVWIGAGFALSHLSFKRYLLFVSGALYISLAISILLSWSEQPFLIFWLLMIVWSTDVGAYIIGSKLGGPKLAPRISPSKTWSGFTGGTLAAILVCYFVGTRNDYTLGLSIPLPISILLLSITGQIGDLIESAVKRYFNVKDSGTIIPGHGGLLDRLDSLLLVTIIYYLLLIFAKL